MSAQLNHSFVRFAALAALLAPGCVDAGDDLASSAAPLIGGQEAEAGQFPATVALMTPLPAVDTRYCNTEQRHCTMTRVGPRAYLSAGHCFADGNILEREHRVVLSPTFKPGAKISISHGVQIWEYVQGTCPEQTFGTQIMVQAEGSQRVPLTVRKIHFHPTYLSNGGEAGVSEGGWTNFNHADVALLEVDEVAPDFVAQAKVKFSPLAPGDAVIIGGHGISGGFAGTAWSGLKFARRTVDAVVGQDFFTRVSDPFGGPGIAPGDSGGAVYLASDPDMLTVVGVNSKSIAFRGSAHVRLDGTGPQDVAGWYTQVLASISSR